MKPLIYRFGSFVVKGYRWRENGRIRYESRWHNGEKIVRKKHRSRALLKWEAEEINRVRAKGRAKLYDGEFTDYETFYIFDAARIASDNGMAPAALAHFLRDYFARARTQAGEAGPLVRDVVASFLASRRAKGLSDSYLRSLTVRLRRFERHCGGMPIGRIKKPQIDLGQWLNALNVAPRTWNNYRADLAELFKFARIEKWLPRDWNEFEAITPNKIKLESVGIFTPDEISDLLRLAPPEMLPAIALGGFAGLRHAEITRLRWEDIKPHKSGPGFMIGRSEHGFIQLPKEITKTGAARSVPISGNLAAWLAPFGNRSGKIYHRHDLSAALERLTERVVRDRKRRGIPGPPFGWKRNGLRHSYGSYRTALVHLGEVTGLDQVALEMGNSPRQVRDHYFELVKPEEARRWFEIVPKSSQQAMLFPQFA